MSLLMPRFVYQVYSDSKSKYTVTYRFIIMAVYHQTGATHIYTVQIFYLTEFISHFSCCKVSMTPRSHTLKS